MIYNKIPRGATMIEMAIAMVIIAILIVVAIPHFAAWMQSTQIRTAAESIQNGLQLARAEAVRRNALVCFELPNSTKSDWNIWASSCTSTDLIQSRSSAEGSSNVTVTTDRTTIEFNGWGRLKTPATTNIDLTNSTGGSCAKDTGPMRCLRIVISPAGQVRMCDPALDSTDPQGC